MKKSYIIVLVTFSLFLTIGIRSVHACMCGQNTRIFIDPNCEVWICGFDNTGPNAWVCTIHKIPNPCGYGKQYEKQYIPNPPICVPEYKKFNASCYGYVYLYGNCENDNIICQQSACPDTTSYNGYTCQMADGSCEWGCIIVNCFTQTGVWDATPSEKQCIQCNGKLQYKRLADTTQKCYDLTDTTWKELPCANIPQTCESACGADPECDEKFPNSFYDTDGDGYNDLYCDSNCKAFKCDSNNQCASFQIQTGKGTYTYYCHRYVDSNGNGHWRWWATVDYTYEDGSPWQECFDGYNNDCDDKTDCADSGCAGVRNPNTGEVCCQTDSNCPPKDNVKGKCRSPSGSGGTPYDYTCVWLPCSSNADCVDGTCCTADRYGPSPGAPNGVCVGKGIYSANRKYLCDPPTWKFNVPTTTNKNIFESILGFFSHFFLQR